MSTAMETRFRMRHTSPLSQMMSGRDFENEQELLELIEDYLFGKMIERGDIGEYVSEKEIFDVLQK